MSSDQENTVHAVEGVRWAALSADIKANGKPDVALMSIDDGAAVAAVFTRNAFCAAPVTVAREHLQSASIRFCLVNAGNANAGTGSDGLSACLQTCESLAEAAGVGSASVLPFSTGVIGELLPADKIVRAVPALLSDLTVHGWRAAANAIMTTDTCAKLRSTECLIGGERIAITGICKGAGMIRPDMATMLAYVATDAVIEQSDLQQLLRATVEQSFNRITVDGDTSTNDACVLVATGQSGVALRPGSDDWRVFEAAVHGLFHDLATDIIRDAEGASKFVTIDVRGGASEAECLAVAFTVAESPLVKTALFASDANWGRILAAVGRSDRHCQSLTDLNVDAVRILLGDVLICERGGRAASYTEALGAREMSKPEITITIDLQRGDQQAAVWTSDLSDDYVRINADYRT